MVDVDWVATPPFNLKVIKMLNKRIGYDLEKYDGGNLLDAEVVRQRGVVRLDERHLDRVEIVVNGLQRLHDGRLSMAVEKDDERF